MNTRDPIILALPTLVGVLAFLAIATAQVPNSIAAPGETVVLKVHGEGAQVYECKASPDAKLVWKFREPIATLITDGSTVGRHYAGPNWELADGSAIVGKVVGDAPGTEANDIPWLKLNVVAQRGNGTFDRRYHRAADQYPRRQAEWRVRPGWQTKGGPIRGRLCFFAQ